MYARGFDEGAVLGCILAYFLFRRETLAVMIWCAIAAIVTLVSLLLLINGSADFGVPGLVISLPSLVVLGRAVLRELHWWDA